MNYTNYELELKGVREIHGPWIGNANDSYRSIGIGPDRNISTFSDKVSDIQLNAPIDLAVQNRPLVGNPRISTE